MSPKIVRKESVRLQLLRKIPSQAGNNNLRFCCIQDRLQGTYPLLQRIEQHPLLRAAAFRCLARTKYGAAVLPKLSEQIAADVAAGPQNEQTFHPFFPPNRLFYFLQRFL